MIWEQLPAHLVRTDSRFLPLPEWLEYSYARCVASRVPRELVRITSPPVVPLSTRCNAVGAYARLLFAETHHCLSDQRGLLLLTDANATIVEMYARPEVLQLLVQSHGIVSGVRLVEDVCGTNAIVLGLRHRRGVVLRGSQHFCRMFNDWYSVAMPLLSQDGCTLGCVSMATEDSDNIVEAAALVKFLAEDINRFSNANATLSCEGEIPTRLTQRQTQVLERFAQGMSYKEIARSLGVSSVKTVEDHLDAVRSKLNVSCRRECIRKAAELGLLHL